MFVRVNAIFNTCGVILHEGRIGGLCGPTVISYSIQGEEKKLMPFQIQISREFITEL